MKNFRCIPLDDITGWEEALKGIRYSFAHTRENCLAMNLTTGFNTYMMYFQKDDIKIICPVAEREIDGFKDIVTPYGFSGFTGNRDFPGFDNYWKEFVNSKNYICGYISINPAFKNNSYFRSEEMFQSTSLYFLNLKLSLTELFENLDSNRKKQIKNYRKAESDFIYDKKILTDFFIENYYNFLKRINASSANYFTRETLKYICGLENVFMVGAGAMNKIEAVYIFAYTGNAGDCLFNVATEDGRKYSPLLLWCGLKFFRSRKIPLMNLGGGIKEDDNVALSKQRFGAYKLPFVSLKQIYNLDLYNRLCRERGADPGNLAGYFPAYRKNLI